MRWGWSTCPVRRVRGAGAGSAWSRGGLGAPNSTAWCLWDGMTGMGTGSSQQCLAAGAETSSISWDRGGSGWRSGNTKSSVRLTKRLNGLSSKLLASQSLEVFETCVGPTPGTSVTSPCRAGLLGKSRKIQHCRCEIRQRFPNMQEIPEETVSEGPLAAELHPAQLFPSFLLCVCRVRCGSATGTWVSLEDPPATLGAPKQQ